MCGRGLCVLFMTSLVVKESTSCWRLLEYPHLLGKEVLPWVNGNLGQVSTAGGHREPAQEAWLSLASATSSVSKSRPKAHSLASAVRLG